MVGRPVCPRPGSTRDSSGPGTCACRNVIVGRGCTPDSSASGSVTGSEDQPCATECCAGPGRPGGWRDGRSRVGVIVVAAPPAALGHVIGGTASPGALVAPKDVCQMAQVVQDRRFRKSVQADGLVVAAVAATASWSEGKGRPSEVVLAAVDPRSGKIDAS